MSEAIGTVGSIVLLVGVVIMVAFGIVAIVLCIVFGIFWLLDKNAHSEYDK